MNTAERRATAALWSIRGVGPVTLREVGARLGPVGELLDQPVERWAAFVPWRGDAQAHVAGIGSLAGQADRLEAHCAREAMQIVFPGDAPWPARLDSVQDAPPLLFMRGPGANAPCRRRLAIVGTRTPDPGAAERLARIAAEAARHGLGIVSGAAVGIDQAAHHGALEAKGETWAFLGSALDEIDAPQQPIVLAMLSQGQTIFSEFPPGFRSNRSSFKLRNRLISGASDAVLVFRAGKGSGALYTAEAALGQRRPVLATPGDPWNAAAEGSNWLLREGRARPHLDVTDLLSAVGLDGSLSPPEPVAVVFEELSAGARTVLDLLSRGSCDFEGMLQSLPDFSSGKLSATLVELEVLGAVVHKGGRRYEKR